MAINEDIPPLSFIIGRFWFTCDGGGLWRDLPDSYEFAFRTYGYI